MSTLLSSVLYLVCLLLVISLMVHVSLLLAIYVYLVVKCSFSCLSSLSYFVDDAFLSLVSYLCLPCCQVLFIFVVFS